MPRKSLLKPDAHVTSVTVLTPAWLAERGVRALLVDLDNTLAPWRSRDPAPEVRAWVRSLQSAGVGVCVLSNSRVPRRVAYVAADLGLPHVAWAGKPRRSGFRRALSALGVARPSEAAVVGDQLLTDVVGGNRIGAVTVLVRPVSPREFIGTRCIRPLEQWILRRCGMEAPDDGARQ